MRLLGFLYGTIAYVVFLGVFVYLIGFVGDLVVPRTIDRGPASPVALAIAIDIGLLMLFALQHSIMARQGFKRRWKAIVPDWLERSTFVLAASLVLAVLMWGWQPLPYTIWAVEPPAARVALWTVFAAGWGIVLLSTFLIDHFHLFGLKQIWTGLRGRTPPEPAFTTPGLYRRVRHPLYLGFLMAFWATPTMSAGHLLFAGVWTSWILLAIRLEERDLVGFHGHAYEDYRRRVPMLLPGRRRAAAPAPERESSAVHT